MEDPGLRTCIFLKFGEFKKYCGKRLKMKVTKSEIDTYLKDILIKHDDNGDEDSFSILQWWKDKESKYQILSQIARDLLSIPITSVASEKAFSAGGRIVNDSHSSLMPKTVEALFSVLMSSVHDSCLCEELLYEEVAVIVARGRDDSFSSFGFLRFRSPSGIYCSWNRYGCELAVAEELGLEMAIRSYVKVPLIAARCNDSNHATAVDHASYSANAFARLSAAYGGTYMLNKPECKVEFDESGNAFGVTSEGETAKCKKVVCDPSYLPNKVKRVGKVARAICIMNHLIPNTNDSHSVQVILPQKQLERKSDM
ncbi:probable secretory pathway GDP dissociation inhibitor 1 [Nymphaea colorata]|nr:probable secretory pathway GDP dissociation inhibitor 1 [Nymphaea colorata]